MPNGNMTTKEYLHRIDQRLSDFIDQCKDDKQDHRREHALMWKLIIALPTSILVLVAVLKLFGV